MSRFLSPREASTYFERPIARVPSVAVGATKVLEEDSDRVAIVWGSSQTVAVWFWVDSTVAVGRGFVQAGNGQPFIMTHQDVGPLVQGEWWAVATSAPTFLSLVEIVLRRWPGR